MKNCISFIIIMTVASQTMGFDLNQIVASLTTFSLNLMGISTDDLVEKLREMVKLPGYSERFPEEGKRLLANYKPGSMTTSEVVNVFKEAFDRKKRGEEKSGEEKSGGEEEDLMKLLEEYRKRVEEMDEES